MSKKVLLTSAALSVLLGATSYAQGPARHRPSNGMSSSHAPLTPALAAIEEERGRLDQAAIAALDAGDYAEEEQDARQSIATGQGSGLAQELLAQALNAQGKAQEALQAYKEIADEGGTFPRNLVPYALLLLKTGQWAQAAAVYNQALPWLPDVGPHPEAPIIHDSDLMQASSHFSPDAPQPAGLAVALHIAQGVTYLGGSAWRHQIPRQEAMAEFAEALRLAPDSPLANYYYGVGWQRLSPSERAKFGNAQEAKAHLQKAVRVGHGAVKKAAQKALQVAMKP